MPSTTQPSVTYLDEPKAGRLNIQYAPAGNVELTENPPRFMWLPVVEDEAHYVIRVSTNEHFPDTATQLSLIHI